MKKTDFDIHFDNAFATMNQSKFEGWFVAMACRVFGTDFELIKAGGQDGDKKSDGRRISTETVYQCYAPESPATFAAKAKAKCSIPDDHIDPQRSAFFMARSVLRDILRGVRPC